MDSLTPFRIHGPPGEQLPRCALVPSKQGAGGQVPHMARILQELQGDGFENCPFQILLSSLLADGNWLERLTPAPNLLDVEAATHAGILGLAGLGQSGNPG